MAHLPGDVIKFEGGLCEDCGEPAVITIVGETDSFGSEYMTLCKECYDKVKNFEPDSQSCEWCHKEAICKPIRDPDEGSNGPVYYVCVACRNKQHQDMEDEMEEFYKKEDLENTDEFY